MIADGRAIAAKLEAEVAEALKGLPQKRLCFIVCGNDPATQQFVAMKTRVADRLGIMVEVVNAPEFVSNEEALAIVDKAVDEKFDGIVVQLPLPVRLDAQEILNRVPEQLDIDVLGRDAKDSFACGTSDRMPPVARAVSEIFDFYKIDLTNKTIVIIGNGKLVGEPVSVMLSRKGIAFTIVDKDTPDDQKYATIASADVVISGVGVPYFITPGLIKEGVVLIDAGTSEQEGKLAGDIHPACVEKASLITPVPGGVGPVTVVSLFANLRE